MNTAISSVKCQKIIAWIAGVILGFWRSRILWQSNKTTNIRVAEKPPIQIGFGKQNSPFLIFFCAGQVDNPSAVESSSLSSNLLLTSISEPAVVVAQRVYAVFHPINLEHCKCATNTGDSMICFGDRGEWCCYKNGAGSRDTT